MAKPHDGEESPAKYRPLPSVDMALLPHELRALRLKQVLLVLAVLAIIGVVVLLSLARMQLPQSAHSAAEDSSGEPPAAAVSAGTSVREEAPSVERPAAAAPAEPEPATGALPDDARGGPTPEVAAVEAVDTVNGSTGLARVVKRFGKARGFRDALVKAGASAAEADALILSLGKLVDFRLGQPEHELIFERDARGVLQRFEYRAGVLDRYEAEREPDGVFTASRVEVKVERRRINKGGYVSDSLGRALEALGLKANLAGVFVEAFEGKIDFKKDVREGDSFRVILEEEYVEGQLLSHGKVQAIQFTGARAGDVRAFWFEPQGESGDFYDENGRALHGGWLRTPLRYDHISSAYNLRRKHPILKRIVPHHGIDYAAAPGTTVWAAADGVVTFAGPRGANGNLISLEHSGGYETLYAHLLRLARGMTKGVRVKQRQPIGQVGSTGRSTGPHLHFALKHKGRFLDPATQLNGPGKLLPDSQLGKFKRAIGQLKRELDRIPLAAAPAPADEPEAPETYVEDETIDL
jgi:murein DD-endopeptidase MepM/ murein hydrolase activator NlpD